MIGRRSAWLVFLVIPGVLALGCSREKSATAARAGKPVVAVEAVRIVQSDAIEEVDVVGSLSAKFQTDVKPEFAGTVTDVYVTEWVKVQKGTPLAQLDRRELESMLRKTEAAVEAAKANVLQAQVARNRSEREYERALKLKEAGLVTQQNVDDATTEKEASAARVSAAEAQLKASQDDCRQMETHFSKALVRSPMNGVVSLRNVNVGDLVGDVAGNKVLFHIVDNRLLDLTVTAPSKEMGKVRVGQTLTFSTDAIPGKTFTGKVTFINPMVNEADRSIKIVAEVRNDSEELKSGLFVKGRIVTGERTGVLQVPRTALLSWDMIEKKADVFVVRGEKVERRAMKTGAVSVDLVEAVSGVASGETVVTRGGFNLKDGDTVVVAQGSGR
ncbi:MAG: efflux RND transporter periplasmic adaptor subunit [Syntrophorhabdales bacterium]|jgi:RND family efflux transporter MFP subunit